MPFNAGWSSQAASFLVKNFLIAGIASFTPPKLVCPPSFPGRRETFLALPALVHREQSGDQVTKQESEFLECESDNELLAWQKYRRRAGARAVADGLDYLGSRHQNGCWNSDHAAEIDTTARILVFLKDIPSFLIDHRLRRKVDESLDWLVEAHTPDAGWHGRSGKDEAGPTAWTILALRSNRRQVPKAALDWLWRCRGRDGGFASSLGSAGTSGLEATAVAARALAHIDSDAERFLCARLQTDAARGSEQLAACAAILDCGKSLVPFPLLNQACQATAGVHPATVQDRALLLRCLLRLRLTRAWALAEDLRSAQRADGGWMETQTQTQPETEPGPGRESVLATAMASSALAMLEDQPGLYFGSDFPRPRRLHQSS